jgi:predicted Zn-dependent peptidase
MGSMFPGHPLGLPIIGTEESIQRLTLAELQQKHGEYYTPENCILTLVSPLSTEQVTQFAEATFGKPWAHARNTTQRRDVLPVDYYSLAKPKRTLVLQNNSDNQYVFKLMLPGAGGLNEKVVHDIIVERLLDDGISSRLPATIREKHGLVYDISADAQSYVDVGTFSIDATISQHSMQRLLDALLIELVRVCQEPPRPDELERLKFRYLFDLEVMGENPSRLITREVTQMFLNIQLPLQREAEIVRSITPETVQQTAKKILTHPRQTVVLVGPRARKFRSSVEKFLDHLTRCGG